MRPAATWLGTIIITAAAMACAHAGDARAAFAGGWRYDAAQSSFVGREPYRGGTMSFIPAGTGAHVTADIVVANGAKFHFEYSDPGDGSIVPVVGNPYYDSQSTLWVGDDTCIRTERRGGKVIGITTMTLAKDGASFTASARRIVPEGKLYTAVVHWKRIEH
jgi:hypothetical protein